VEDVDYLVVFESLSCVGLAISMIKRVLDTHPERLIEGVAGAVVHDEPASPGRGVRILGGADQLSDGAHRLER
jgi:hypothetical protein